MRAKVRVELQRACDVAIPDDEDVRRWIEAALDAAGEGDRGRRDIVVRVVDEEESRDLNSRYRHKDSATNVLAFPAAEANDLASTATWRPGHALGDLAICGPVVEREAREQGKSPQSHWAHLLVHGTLHLLGYDHQTEAEAAAMERLEASILADRGFDDPYAAR